MKVLSINAGSSSLKFKMYEMPKKEVLIYGYIEKIGSEANCKIITDKTEEFKGAVANHEDAVRILIKALFENNVIESLDEIKGIGHRIVNGAGQYQPQVINDTVIRRLKSLSALSPVHMKGHIAGIRAFQKLAPEITQIAFYDTAFHHTIPEENYLYSVPYEWYEKYGIRKFGFHGISCKYITNEMEKELNKKVNLIICHIGNGASVTAVKNSKSVDNSMGFTANSGLMMGTRCGTIDYTILPYLAKKTKKTIQELDEALNYQSGLEGFVKGASDNRDLQNAIDSGNKKAILANEMYINRVIEFIAKYYIMLDNIDALVFCGGVGENNIVFRKKILLKLKKIGITLNEKANNHISKFSATNRGIISNKDSSIPCYVIPTDEELMIAKDTYEFIK